MNCRHFYQHLMFCARLFHGRIVFLQRKTLPQNAMFVKREAHLMEQK